MRIFAENPDYLLQAIEGFALMVKRTAQTLQSFGTELAETELPNEIKTTTILLSTHTSKRDKMKVSPFLRYMLSPAPPFALADKCCPMTLCLSRRTYWLLCIKAAGCWRASMNL